MADLQNSSRARAAFSLLLLVGCSYSSGAGVKAGVAPTEEAKDARFFVRSHFQQMMMEKSE